jgi:hypothetical protein
LTRPRDRTRATAVESQHTVCLATGINLPGAVNWGIIQLCFGHHFWWYLRNERCLMDINSSLLQYNWLGEGNRLNMGRNNKIHPWRSLFSIMNCLLFDTNTAQLFAHNVNLSFNVTISMVWDWNTLELMTTARVLIVLSIGTHYPTWVLFFYVFA